MDTTPPPYYVPPLQNRSFISSNSGSVNQINRIPIGSLQTPLEELHTEFILLRYHNFKLHSVATVNCWKNQQTLPVLHINSDRIHHLIYHLQQHY
ncbi:unnamed protein product [Schistosoma turkestanicum]|nr:unnamed protein product [Schistosoma turkestanicum]